MGRCPGNVIRQSNGTGFYAAPAEVEEMLMPVLCQKTNDLSSQLEIDHSLISTLTRFLSVGGDDIFEGLHILAKCSV